MITTTHNVRVELSTIEELCFSCFWFIFAYALKHVLNARYL